MVAHTTLLNISYHGSYIGSRPDFSGINFARYRDIENLGWSPQFSTFSSFYKDLANVHALENMFDFYYCINSM